MVGGLALGLSAGASAEDYTLSYSVAELNTQHGVQDVHKRIVKAARQYCPPYAETKSLDRRRDCVDDVVNDLVTKVAHPGLTQFHNNPDAVNVASATPAKADRS